MRDLEQQIVQTKQWSEKNSIIIINGFFSNENNSHELIINEDLNTFLKLGLTSGVSDIIITTDVFDKEMLIETEFNNEKAIDDSLRSEILGIINQYEVYNNKVFYLRLGWVKNGFMYTYTDIAQWYVNLQEMIENASKDYEERIRIENQDKLLYSKEKQSTLARIIAGDHRYLPYSTRGAYLNRLFTEEIQKFDETLNLDEIELVTRRIKFEVNRIFESEFRKEAELGLSLKISNMLEQGFTKAKIMALLELTDGIYEKLKAHN